MVVSIIGLALIPRLSVNLNPSNTTPTLQIRSTVKDASPQQVEKLVVAPLENVLSQIRDLKSIQSTARYNGGVVTLSFTKNADMQYKRFEVSALIRQLYPSLDQSVSYPVLYVRGKEEENSEVLQYTLSAPMASYHIKEMLDAYVVKNIQGVNGVKDVIIYGETPLQISIRFDATALDHYDISLNEVVQTIREAGGIQYPGLARLPNNRQLVIQIDQRFTAIKDFSNVTVAQKNGVAIPLHKIATIVREEQKPTRYYRINGENFVTLSIEARNGVNRLDLARIVKAEMAKAESKLPENYALRLVYDDTEFLEKELDKLYKRSLLSIGILVLFIFLINRNWKYLVVLFSGVLVNCCLAIIGVWLFDVQIHLYSLAGLTISFGLIVDNAIVMIDHLHKYKNKHLFLALLAASLTTIAALLLVFFLPEEQRVNLIDFTKVVSILLGSSLLVALFFTPALYNILNFNRQNRRQRAFKSLRRSALLFRYYAQFIHWNARYKKAWIVGLVLIFGIPIFMLPAKWDDHEWYNNTIGSDFYQETIRPYTDPALGGSLRMFVRNVYERSSYREKEKTKLYVNAHLPYGNTLEQLNVIIKNFEAYLDTQNEIDLYTTHVYSGQQASIEIMFKESYEFSGYPYQLKARLSSRSTNWSGVDWNIYGVGQGFSTGSGDRIPSFRVLMKGYNYDELETQANLIAQKLLEHPRIQEVNTNERVSYQDKASQEFVLRPDLEKLATNGASLAGFVSVINKYAPASGAITQLSLQNNWWPVFVEEQSAQEFDKYLLEHESLPYENERIPISDVSTLKLESTTNAIYKEDRNYIRVVSFEYYGSARFGDKYLEEVLQEYESQKPLGYEAEKRTFSWNLDNAKKQYGLLGILVIAIFFICSILFESFRYPFYILILIPIAFVGLFLTFGVFEFYFDQGGYAAFILLGGLTVNAGIYILYDFLNKRKLGNKSGNRAFLKAVSYKAQPILLTIFSTCFGLIPFLLTGQNEVFWFSLAAGTIGGLIFSMIGVFLFLPVLAMKKTV